MYAFLLPLHSVMRWLVLVSLVYAIYRAVRGCLQRQVFTATDNMVRHVTATIAHIQLVVGYLLYFNSPLIAYFRGHYKEASRHFYYLFFGMVHIGLMTLAIIILTIGSAITKRKQADRNKFLVMAAWYCIALLIILIAIPWPFSPLAQRPFIRTF